MGWIHDPIQKETVWAAKGQGCWHDNTPCIIEHTPSVKDMKGSLSGRVAKRLFSKKGAPKEISRVGCVGRDYMDLALGRIDFARYAFQLKPWDHAAGVLMHKEAGGTSRLIKAQQDYHPDLTPKEAMKRDEILMLAPDMTSLNAISDML